MKKASFTLIEILVGLVILSILATLGIPQYQNFIEQGRAKACAVNLDTLQRALDIYVMEHDAIPASLDDLAKGNLQLISCPKDDTSPIKVQGGRSYALSSALVGLSAQQYKALPPDTVLIGDCEATVLSTASNLAERHKLGGDDRGMTVSKNHKVCERSQEDVSCIKEMSELY